MSHITHNQRQMDFAKSIMGYKSLAQKQLDARARRANTWKRVGYNALFIMSAAGFPASKRLRILFI